MKPTNGPSATVDEYLAGVSEPARSTLQTLRARIRAVVPPEATEGLSYGMPAFKYKGKSLVAYASFKNHCSLFPMSGTLIDDLLDDLKHLTTSKGTIQFPVDKPLAAALVKKVVRARLAEQKTNRQR